MVKALQQETSHKQSANETDEEKLEWETVRKEQKTGRNSKKRKANSSLEVSPDMSSQKQEADKNNNEKGHLPPPIFTSGVKDFNTFKEAMLQNVKCDTRLKMLANGDINVGRCPRFA
ncbi:unnamed protein product [Lasius platythorax]|uniref:Uncharacterized protein n=2 Tax=Lasius TaxID=488720 RepID=A0A0J7JXG6_LASNI|nr:hypothetical protein RF55_21989 [Lasius niger]